MPVGILNSHGGTNGSDNDHRIKDALRHLFFDAAADLGVSDASVME